MEPELLDVLLYRITDAWRIADWPLNRCSTTQCQGLTEALLVLGCRPGPHAVEG